MKTQQEQQYYQMLSNISAGQQEQAQVILSDILSQKLADALKNHNQHVGVENSALLKSDSEK